MFPKVVYFKGLMVASIEPILNQMQEIALVFDGAYGELVVFNSWDGAAWDWDRVTRHLLRNGRLTCEQEHSADG
jgi:hypothetical protein